MGGVDLENKNNSQDRNELIPMLIQVSQLYYQENLSQQEIADRLDLSRSLIALYLKRARELGIVRIEIVDPRNNSDNLSDRLCDHFKLKHCAVVSSVSTSDLLTRRALGQAMAAYLDKTLQDGDVLGLGWGRTVLEMANTLTPTHSRRIDVVPLLGESGYTGSYTQLNQGIMQVARLFSGTPTFYWPQFRWQPRSSQQFDARCLGQAGGRALEASDRGLCWCWDGPSG